jgi:hypothetical protein
LLAAANQQYRSTRSGAAKHRDAVAIRTAGFAPNLH